jgi:hypothetical protein
MTGSPADGAPFPAVHADAARRRSAGIYGTIVATAVLAAGGAHLATVPLAVAVTLIAGTFGVMMILLKLVVTH